MSESFVGREQELAKIKDEFDSGKKLGIMEGHAGIGKTALAREFAEREKLRFPGGVNYVRAFVDAALKHAISAIRASSLLVVDDAEGLNPSLAESISSINETSRKFNALFTARMAPALEAIRKSQEAFRIHLEPFSNIDFSNW